MMKWLDDTVVYPKDSEWFGQYDNHKNVIQLQDSDQYKEDWLGLRTLNETGRLHMHAVEGDHMHMDMKDITDIVMPFLLA
jgi:palmitoyl-protein thioesterase